MFPWSSRKGNTILSFKGNLQGKWEAFILINSSHKKWQNHTYNIQYIAINITSG